MITLLPSHEPQVCKNCFRSSIRLYLENWFSFLNALLDPQVKGSFSWGHRVFQLSRGTDGWFALSVPACWENYWWAFFFFLQNVTCLNRSICFQCLVVLKTFLHISFKQDIQTRSQLLATQTTCASGRAYLTRSVAGKMVRWLPKSSRSVSMTTWADTSRRPFHPETAR